ncbi:DUF4199 domain-containing protein [Lentiprolixibacter aurantiacus]|uniref:DUF4199 domain-containing protein n=1 Tax=Lentiprolixibacter aurantiacus TaxID=2993939 RepID=A0AAE3MLV4_9FLAO|nr:DUF4199 domain-containing protein [Lentiprolixibacter aurantiacus]MCX2720235.1 DUF4199 domain-containing protein [Lentiprolixibacter aurantiacus]
MEDQQPKTGKFSLNYGLILGALGVAFGLMLYSMDAHTSQDISNTIIGLVMMVAVVIWGIYAFRNANGGFLTISQALKLGAGIALISAIISIVYTIFLSNVLDPEFTAKIMDARMAELEAGGQYSAEQIQQQKEMGIKFFWFGYPVILIVNVLIGLVIGLIGGLILKKAKPE